MNRPVAAGRDLRREIGKWGFGAIALNGTIGAGIFALPAIAVQQAGWFSPWVFALCGALIMAIVLVFARVASLVGDTGGPVAYAATAFGPFAGFQAGWLLTLSRAAAFAANAHLIVTYLAWFLPPLASGPLHTATVLALCLLLAIVNILGVRQGMLALFVFTALKLLPLLLLAAGPLQAMAPIQHWQTANGARVYFVPAPELPIVDVNVTFAAGSARDAGHAGLAAVVGEVVQPLGVLVAGLEPQAQPVGEVLALVPAQAGFALDVVPGLAPQHPVVL